MTIVAWVLACISIAQGVRLAARAKGEQPALWVVVVGYVAVLAAYAGVAYGARTTFVQWAQEDGPIEWATVAAFVLAGALYGIRGVRERGWLGAALMVMAAFCLFVAGEEVSWGQRLFGFVPPEAFLEGNFQQELNVHNFVKNTKVAGFKLDSGDIVTLLALAYGLVAPLFLRWVKFGWTERVKDAFPTLDTGALFVAVAALEVGYPVSYTGEVAELLFGLAFLAVCLDGAGRPARHGWLALGVVPLGFVFAPLLLTVTTGSDEEGQARARQELALIAADLARDFDRAVRLRRKGSVHKRLFTAVRKGYFDPGTRWTYLEHQATPAQDESGRRDARGFFIDPWATPYWVHWNKDRGRLLVYSIGPNRRRDIDPRAAEANAGDDLVVVVDTGD